MASGEEREAGCSNLFKLQITRGRKIAEALAYLEFSVVNKWHLLVFLEDMTASK